MLQHLPIVLLFAVVCVGSLLMVGMFAAAFKQARRGRDQRIRRKAYRMKAEQARIKAAMASQPIPLARGELTSVFRTLEESARFARVASPPPSPAGRMPKGSVAPPVRAARPSDDREHRTTMVDLSNRVGAAKRA